MSNRIPCKNSNCSHTILKTTAERNNGFCMPCVNRKKKDEYDKYIKENRKDINQFENITDIVEILKIIHKPKEINPLINWITYPKTLEEIYSNLTNNEIEKIVQYANSLMILTKYEEAEDIYIHLKSYTNANIDDYLSFLIKNNIYYPSFLFYKASAKIRNLLLIHLETDIENKNLILLALAWIQDEETAQQFYKWKLNQLECYSSLEEYTHDASWELDSKGNKRNLYFNKSYKLEKGKSLIPKDFITITEHSDKCPNCSSSLTNLFELKSPRFDIIRLSNGIKELTVTTCEICSSYDTMYSKISNSNTIICSQDNQYSNNFNEFSVSWEKMPENSLHPTKELNPIANSNQFLNATFSKIGGFPTWIQNAEYPKCSNCSKTMTFYGQISCEDIEEYAEGIYYSFICKDCMITATSYQQS